MLMTEKPSWECDGRDWPNRDASQFVKASGLRWHVQRAGKGPTILLIHGTGASTHSFRDLIPLLAPDFDVVAPDLPGHGFTDPPPFRELSLSGMSRAVSGLLRRLGVNPIIVVGHSAGAAILVRMSLDGILIPSAIVSLNGALLPFHGVARHLFSPTAKLLARLPIVPQLFAYRASDPETIKSLIRNTGSRIDATGLELYRRLASNPSHVSSALGMMANWDLESLAHDLPRLKTRLVVVTGANDMMVPPAQQQRVRRLLPGAELITLPGLGHLAHEERPSQLAQILARLAAADTLSGS
jgi:magnesium chelatase accessory protein